MNVHLLLNEDELKMRNYFMKKMTLLTLSLLVLSLTACSSANSDTKTTTTPEPEVKVEAKNPAVKTPAPTASIIKNKAASCTCMKMWMPVCGENKKTYGNSCEADCAGVKYTSGECSKTKNK
jgi:hypothetical protein